MGLSIVPVKGLTNISRQTPPCHRFFFFCFLLFLERVVIPIEKGTSGVRNLCNKAGFFYEDFEVKVKVTASAAMRVAEY